MDQVIRALNQGLAAIENAADWIAGIGMVVMMTTITVDGVGRYLAGIPLPGSVEFNELYLIPAVVFLSLARTQRRGGNISLDIVKIRLPTATVRVIDIAQSLVAALLFGVISIMAGILADRRFTMNSVTGGEIAFPTWIGISFVAFGTGLLALRLLLQAFRPLSERDRRQGAL